MNTDLLTGEAAPIRSTADERANTLTHAFGFALSLLAALAMSRVVFRLNVADALACIVFVLSLLVLYAVSTLSHAVRPSPLQDRLRAWDQGVVYLLIAGTYTPLIWIGDNSLSQGIALTLVWCAACLGFYSKVFAGHRVNAVQTQSYLLLGWVPAIFLRQTVTVEALAWVAAGGLCYTVGVVFLKFDYRVKFFHAAWHLLVVSGSACHFYAIYRLLVIPKIELS